jgi:predicted transcriptional regulator
MPTRTHIVLPDDVLEELDRLVGKRTRSQFIEEAVRAKLQRERLTRALNEGAGFLKDKDYPEWETPEKISAWVRKQRSEGDRPMTEFRLPAPEDRA